MATKKATQAEGPQVVNSTALRKTIGSVLDAVLRGEMVVVERGGRPTAVMVDARHIEAIAGMVGGARSG